MWTKKRLLMAGKTYPEFSKKHLETVCTVAVDADTGKLLRVYPLSLRYMENPPAAFDWFEAEVEKNTSDPRPESFRVRQDTVRVLNKIGTEDAWRERSTWVLRPTNVFPSVEALRGANEDDGTSLGLVKVRELRRVYAKLRTPEDHRAWQAKKDDAERQHEIAFGDDTEIRDLKFPWVQYRVEFLCNDPECTGHDMSVHDWGVYVLDMKLEEERGYVEAQRLVIQKLERELDPKAKDTHFFLGNTKAFPQAFFIGALYYPPVRRQAEFGFLQIADPNAIGRPREQRREYRAVAARGVRLEAEEG